MKTINSDDVDFLKFVGKQESQFISPKGEWEEETIKLLLGGEDEVGDLLPWSKSHHTFRLRPGELSIWAAPNGHGKSMLTGMVALFLAQYTRVLMASLEMKPAQTLKRMVRQASGQFQPSQMYAERFFNWRNEDMFIYDQLDSVDSERILGMLHYAAQELKVNHVFLDSLMKCGIKTDDYNAQKEFVDRLCWLARTENIHIHLIHHMRKGESEGKRPGKYDVKGAGELVDMADNLLICWRNKSKEERQALLRAGIEIQNGRKIVVEDHEPDTILTVSKQRHGEWEGPINLWFHKNSLQYIPKPNAGAMPFDLEE